MVSDVARRLQQAPTVAHFPVKKQLKNWPWQLKDIKQNIVWTESCQDLATFEKTD